MTEWVDIVLLGEEVEDTSGNEHTRKFIKHLKSVTGALLKKASTISLEYYIKEI